MRQPVAGDAWSIGAFTFSDPELASVAARKGVNQAWILAFERYAAAAPAKVTGNFAVVATTRDGSVWLAIDRFAIRTLCYQLVDGQLLFHERADVVAANEDEWDPQAIFSYLYFHAIPAPQTIFASVRRLPAGHCAVVENGSISVTQWWTPRFVETRRVPFAALRDEFRELLRTAVGRASSEGSVGCFLSGGTDSSTLAGVLGEVSGKPVPTFSIGFAAQGYDETAYARVAAQHFRTDHHEYYITPDDLVESIQSVVGSCDQPFGNSSIVPAYYCAKLAADAGLTTLLGGDGGDELFGGNSRYAKQRIFDAYQRIPVAIRRGLIEKIVDTGALGHISGLRKVASYVEQARVPMPDRLQMYNLIVRLGLAEVLTPEFLASIDPEQPVRQQQMVYRSASAETNINRNLAFDWRYTLADNDLPKVKGATALAGIGVAFPMLDDGLVDFSLALEPSLKLKRLQLRWFFKESLRGFLPDAIIAKKKHGFGLPFGAWLLSNPELKSLAFDSIRAAGQRGIVRKDFLQRLTTEHLMQHPGYFGEMVWILMAFEQWTRREPGLR